LLRSFYHIFIDVSTAVRHEGGYEASREALYPLFYREKQEKSA